MLVEGQPWQTVWIPKENPRCVRIIDQRKLPWELCTKDLTTVDQVVHAISDMQVRGAGCIGATAAAGMYLASLHAGSGGDAGVWLETAAVKIKGSRPTAVNLAWAVDRMLGVLRHHRTANERIAAAWSEAHMIFEEDVASCRSIGQHGLALIQKIAESKKPGEPVRVLTHCNAGWLAFVDVGSATAPIYAAQDAGIPIFVWVDETRPRNQGARLTAWELAGHGVEHAVVADNAGGHLMQQGLVDLVITGADRVAANGDVANKIGTYLKALAASDNGIPFYVALPSPTIDFALPDGSGIPIEERAPEEISRMDGPDEAGELREILLVPEKSPCRNPAFDVTPHRLVTGLITERGVCPATREGIASLFPDRI
jgi:methylthioribose-1-phosphate isomerase